MWLGHYWPKDDRFQDSAKIFHFHPFKNLALSKNGTILLLLQIIMKMTMKRRRASTVALLTVYRAGQSRRWIFRRTLLAQNRSNLPAPKNSNTSLSRPVRDSYRRFLDWTSRNDTTSPDYLPCHGNIPRLSGRVVAHSGKQLLWLLRHHRSIALFRARFFHSSYTCVDIYRLRIFTFQQT